MKLHHLSRFRAVTTLSHNPLALLGSFLLCVAPVVAAGQSVTFVDAQITLVALPYLSAVVPFGIAVDTAGNLFFTNGIKTPFAAELARTATGYGPMTILPTNYLSTSYGIAVDSADDVFIADTFHHRIVELLKTSTGYGPQMTLPYTGSAPYGVAVDSNGDVFVVNGQVVELPRTATGYGTQTTLAFSDLTGFQGIALDSAGDVFASGTVVAELPRTGTGWGPQMNFPQVDPNGFTGVTVDSAGDVFLVESAESLVQEYPHTVSGYGPLTTLPFIDLHNPLGVAVDSTGDVFVSSATDNQLVELQTKSANFGNVSICTPVPGQPGNCFQQVTLRYKVTASGVLGTTLVLTDGKPNLDFTLDGSTCTGAVTEGARCRVNLSFTPTAPGTYTGSVEITDASGRVIATTVITGTGVPSPTGLPLPTFSPASLIFPAIAFGSSETMPLTVTNSGGGTLNLMPSITGQSYQIVGSTCGAGVTSSNSCTLDVNFSPIAYGQHNDALIGYYSGATAPTVPLHGYASGVYGGTTVLQFGTQRFGSSQTLPLTITNYGVGGESPVSIGTAINGQSYTIAGSTCGAGVVQYGTCTLQLKFAPITVGVHHDALTLTPSGGAAPSTVVLEGVASGLVAGSTMLDFGSIAFGTTKIIPLTVTNSGLPGSAKVGTNINGHSYKILDTAENTCLAGIGNGQTCTLPVEFSPETVDVHHDVLTLFPTGGAASTIYLRGTATAP